MRARMDLATTIAKWGGRTVAGLGFVAGVVLLLLWLAGKFTPKVPTTEVAAAAPRKAADGKTVPVPSGPIAAHRIGGRVHPRSA